LADDTVTAALPTPLNFLAGGGEMGRLIRAHDWAATPLGPPGTWPQSLRTAIRIMLTSRQPIWVGWGQDLIYLYNDAYLSIIGGKHTWALGRPTREVWSEIWPEIGPMLTTAMGGVEGTYVEEQLLIMERNGYAEETYYTFSYSPIPDDDGMPGGIICANSDDTGRVVSERQLALLSRVSAATIDARTRNEACERALAGIGADSRDLVFAALYGRDAGEVALSRLGSVGIGPDHPAVPDLLPLSRAALWPVLPALESGELQLVADPAPRLGVALPAGTLDRPCTLIALLPVPRKSEVDRDTLLLIGLNPYRLVGSSYRTFLDRLAAQIGDAIASADAYEAERLRGEALAELDRAKTAFFSNVSHEFRTPLTLMLGPLEDLLQGAAPPEQQKSLIETAHRNGVRLLRLVNSLLDFSRIEAGRARAAYVRTDLVALTREVASTFRSATEKVGLTLEVDAAPLSMPAYVDRDMWEKILLNLLSNAFKFTLRGGIRVTVREESGMALVRVADTGAGIPAEELPKLFERFHRVENQPSRSFEGTGIGLALVQELVKLHQGEIKVESTIGEGSSFTIALPLGRAHLPADQIHEPAGGGQDLAARAAEYVEEARRWDASTAVPQAADALDQRPRILVADDNADMRDYLLRLLSPHWRVETAEDGVQALDSVRRALPDLLLTDVMMPELDGFGLLEAIRADEALHDLPVIVLSARAGEEARIEGLAAGADDYLIKPFTARELVARIESNLRLAAIRRESKAAVERREADLRHLNAVLEERVTAEVAERLKAEDALRQAHKMEAVGRLTGGIAHDFNNLLTVILGGLDTLQRARIAEEGRTARALEMAMQGAQRAGSLTSRLLAFSRQQALDPKPTELDQLIFAMSEILHRTLGEQIMLEAILPPDLWRVEIDQNQLESALLNLAVNARDAMTEGGKLTIAAKNTVLEDSGTEFLIEPGDYVAISISDTGHGMSRDTVARAFDPFFTTKPTGQGTGLGLSMVYGFAKQSGGHITIDSAVGRGTTVTLFFPRYDGEVEAAPAPLEQTAPHARDGEVVLVVEDNDDVRLYGTSILSELGYRVLEAANGAEALSLIEQDRRIDLLFTDVILPGMSGKAVAEQATTVRPDLKVLFATGYSRDAIIHHGRVDPGVNLLLKPFTYEQVASRVREILDR
jgi:signal transduction histidine kinase